MIKCRLPNGLLTRRRLVWEELVGRAKERAAKEEKRRKRARDDFMALLEDTRGVKAGTTWDEAQPLLERMPEYKAVCSMHTWMQHQCFVANSPACFASTCIEWPRKERAVTNACLGGISWQQKSVRRFSKNMRSDFAQKKSASVRNVIVIVIVTVIVMARSALAKTRTRITTEIERAAMIWITGATATAPSGAPCID